jgi:hypothetical protein
MGTIAIIAEPTLSDALEEVLRDELARSAHEYSWCQQINPIPTLHIAVGRPSSVFVYPDTFVVLRGWMPLIAKVASNVPPPGSCRSHTNSTRCR